MSPTRVGLAALAVLTLLLAWRELERRLGRSSPQSGGTLVALLVESVLLTLFAGLWFGSLGAGGVVVLFLCVGALIEVPVRLRTARVSELPWMVIGAGVARVVVAGWLLKMIMG